MNARVKVSIIIDVSRFNHFLDNKEILTTLLRMYLIDNGSRYSYKEILDLFSPKLNSPILGNDHCY